jgi:hypothetical protein
VLLTIAGAAVLGVRRQASLLRLKGYGGQAGIRQKSQD